MTVEKNNSWIKIKLDKYKKNIKAETRT